MRRAKRTSRTEQRIKQNSVEYSAMAQRFSNLLTVEETPTFHRGRVRLVTGVKRPHTRADRRAVAFFTRGWTEKMLSQPQLYWGEYIEQSFLWWCEERGISITAQSLDTTEPDNFGADFLLSNGFNYCEIKVRRYTHRQARLWTGLLIGSYDHKRSDWAAGDVSVVLLNCGTVLYCETPHPRHWKKRTVQGKTTPQAEIPMQYWQILTPDTEPQLIELLNKKVVSPQKATPPTNF